MAGMKGRSGRLPKQVDQEMIEALKVYKDDVFRVLHENILKGEYWAIRIWFERMYGKPKEQTNLTVNTNEPPFNIKDIIKFN